MIKIPKRIVLVNIFGTLGYLMVVFAAVLFVSVVIMGVMQSPFAPSITDGNSVSKVPTPAGGSSVISAVIAYSITALLVVVTFVVFVALPYMIGLVSSKLLRKALKLAKIHPSRRHLFLAKGCATTLPLLGFFVYSMTMATVDMMFSAIYITAVVVTVLALISFCIQAVLARSLTIPDKAIW